MTSIQIIIMLTAPKASRNDDIRGQIPVL